MNWSKLKEKFPKSEIEIREHYNKTRIEDGRSLINSFLISKGYNVKLGFIDFLKDYESIKTERHEKKN